MAMEDYGRFDPNDAIIPIDKDFQLKEAYGAIRRLTLENEDLKRLLANPQANEELVKRYVASLEASNEV